MNDVPRGPADSIPPLFAKHDLLKRPKWAMAIVLGAVLPSTIAIYLLSLRSPRVPGIPPAIVFSACTKIAPGARHITSDYGTGFDVPDKAFMVHAGSADMPPGVTYILNLKDSDAKMVVSYDDYVFRDLKTAFPTFSEHVEDRNILTPKGRLMGTDHWGYLKSGEPWRYVKFSSGDAAGYGPTSAEAAKMLDQVLDSACLSPDAYFLK